MAQQYGAAQPIADFFGFGKKADKPATSKPDTSWHDAMVKRANASFQKQGVGAKTAPKPAAKKAVRKSTSKRYGR